MSDRNYNRRPRTSHKSPKTQHRYKPCNISVQQDEKFCSTCVCRWSVDNEEFTCPNK